MLKQDYIIVISVILIILVFSLYLYYSKQITEGFGFGYPIFPQTTTCTKKNSITDCYKNEPGNFPGLNKSSLYTSNISRSLNRPGRSGDNYYSSRKNPTTYNPPCLTEKPYGNSMATYQYWKWLPALLRRQYQDCDKYECSSSKENGYTALPILENCLTTSGNNKTEPDETLACDPVNPEYYNSPEDFCRLHPEDYPCANWWLKNPEQIRDQSLNPSSWKIPTNIKVKPQVPEMKNDYGFCLSNNSDCKLNDGRGLLMINRFREDHGLC